MRTRKLLLAVLLLITVGVYVATEKEGGPADVILKTLLGKYPDLELDLNAPPPDVDRTSIAKHFSALNLHCYSEQSNLGDYVCWSDIGKFNGIPAKLVAFFFEGKNLSNIRISFNGWNHKKLLEQMKKNYGEPELTHTQGIHGESMIQWHIDTGIIAASQKLKIYDESVVLWISKGAIFRKLIGEVEKLAKKENETSQINRAKEVKREGTSAITEFNTDGYFYGSLLATRKIPAFLNSELIKWIKDNANRLSSPFMMELASRVYVTDQQEAIKWYAVFRLLSSYDTARCKDKTAAQGALQVTMLYPHLNNHVKNDAQSYVNALPLAMQWVKEQNYQGSPLWLCAHGISAFRFDENSKPLPVPVEELIYPASEWPDIWNRVMAGHEQMLRNPM
jgi:hypothetical protein